MSSNGNTNPDVATVYGEEVHVPGLAGWLAEIDEQGYVMVPDWISPERVKYIGVPREEVAKMPERLQRVLGYQHGMSVAGPGMVDLRDPLTMMDRVHFGYDVNGPDIPAIG